MFNGINKSFIDMFMANMGSCHFIFPEVTTPGICVRQIEMISRPGVIKA